MPLYDYHCKKCEETYEIKVPLSKLNQEIKCPECKTKLKRLINSAFIKPVKW